MWFLLSVLYLLSVILALYPLKKGIETDTLTGHVLTWGAVTVHAILAITPVVNLVYALAMVWDEPFTPWWRY